MFGVDYGALSGLFNTVIVLLVRWAAPIAMVWRPFRALDSHWRKNGKRLSNGKNIFRLKIIRNQALKGRNILAMGFAHRLEGISSGLRKITNQALKGRNTLAMGVAHR